MPKFGQFGRLRRLGRLSGTEVRIGDILAVTMRDASARSSPGYISRPVIATAIPPTAAMIPATGNILLFEMK